MDLCLNQNWRFFRGDVEQVASIDFNDEMWVTKLLQQI